MKAITDKINSLKNLPLIKKHVSSNSDELVEYMRIAFISLGAAAVTYSPVLCTLFDRHSKFMDLYISGITALFLYNGSPVFNKSVLERLATTSKTSPASDDKITLATVFMAFQAGAFVASFYNHTKLSCVILVLGHTAVLISDKPVLFQEVLMRCAGGESLLGNKVVLAKVEEVKSHVEQVVNANTPQAVASKG